MNNFDVHFFQKYIPEGQEMEHVIHGHWIKIYSKVFLWLFLGILIPVTFYYFSFRLRDLIPFYVIEGYMTLIYIKLVYDIFDWYNDVWIITRQGVIDLDWSLFKTKMSTIEFANIEGLEVEESGFTDKLLKKGDIVIHKIGDDSFVLPDCFQPYNALNQIEAIKNDDNFDEYDHQDDRFDKIMDTLGGVVESYLHEKHPEKQINDKRNENISKYSQSDNSIDLR
ncbi:MAG: hypothetical protein GY828_00505 [Candidatus Gracilibacteria bacterium]|nr:hypothetical protein [Candidatus Gracilibacteria bacterium]